MTCKLSAIVAVCDDWGIGCEGDMVVSNRADMRHFVACTKGCPVIMGRKTLLSFPGGRPLKNRRNIVLTRDDGLCCTRASTWCIALTKRSSAVADEPVAWVIGGGEVYRQFLPYCVEAEVTHNHCVHAVDTYFPDLGRRSRVGDCAGVAGLPRLPRARVTRVVDYEFVTYRRVEA